MLCVDTLSWQTRHFIRRKPFRLDSAGYEVLTAHDGESAVESAIKNHPDVILMDNYMPKMSGLDAMAQLAEHPETVKLPVVMISASLRDRQKAMEQGARYFLQKPCDAKTISTALSEAVAEPCRTGLQ